MPEEPRGQRVMMGILARAGVRTYAARGRSRSAGGQHVQLHRGGAEGIRRGYPGDGGTQENLARRKN